MAPATLEIREKKTLAGALLGAPGFLTTGERAARQARSARGGGDSSGGMYPLQRRLRSEKLTCEAPGRMVEDKATAA